MLPIDNFNKFKIFLLNKAKTNPPLVQMENLHNRLYSETSPYLLQHASNPVHWFPWGSEAFEHAEAQRRLVLVSVGYSSCHWCHVMEREVFSQPDVAELLNEHFVCIKVDREERPDVDQIYMNAVHIITRSGGWPLNCFTLPNGKPVFGGTYFTKSDWLDILKGLIGSWQEQPERVIEVAHDLSMGVAESGIVKRRERVGELQCDELRGYTENWKRYFDARYGGTKGAPKFPMPGSLQFLQAYATFANDGEIQKHIEVTLKSMAQGGIFDHIGGGFFRYSVDDRWEVPHFEKMLYDNAQMVSLYSNAYRLNPNELYRDVVYSTLGFINREMRSELIGYYSAIDADSEGEEGLFYTWTKQELEQMLGSHLEHFAIAYGVSATGNHLGRNVLRRVASDGEVACVLGIEGEGVEPILARLRTTLMETRGVRTRPNTDDKHILAWNALMVKALVDAYIAFNDKTMLNDAIGCIQFVEENLVQSDGNLTRIHCKGKSSTAGFLDDYAFLIQAYTALYQASYNEQWVTKAKELSDIAIDLFLDPKSGMMYYSHQLHRNLIARKMELTDGVIPSSNAVMAQNLLTLGVYLDDSKYSDIALQMLANMRGQLQRGGPYVYQWGMLYLQAIRGPAIVGAKRPSKLLEIMRRSHHPFTLPYLARKGSTLPILCNTYGDDAISLCMGQLCNAPTNSLDEAVGMLNAQE